MANKEYWIILDGDRKELKYPKPLDPGNEYFIEIHVAKVYKLEGKEFKHEICQPVLKKTFRAGKKLLLKHLSQKYQLKKGNDFKASYC